MPLKISNVKDVLCCPKLTNGVPCKKELYKDYDDLWCQFHGTIYKEPIKGKKHVYTTDFTGNSR